ncbi:hypothetical protein [uncultured Lamprocystis sp.]|nr:hypothetical protein [uncultured Lamprocystis sp.]
MSETESPKFGKDYYGVHPNTAEEKQTAPSVPREFQELIATDVYERIKRVHKRWNLRIRELVRTETGFKLSIGDDRNAVPILIIDGLPKPLEQALLQDPDPSLWWLAINAPLLEQTAEGLSVLVSDFDRARILQNPGEIEPGDAHALSEYIRLLLAIKRIEALRNRIFQIETDVLGAYFFRRCQIQIYWMAIGLIAPLIGVSIEDLTTITLTHELAHAYTHLGGDIDGNRWDVSAFASSDLVLVEGLAQYYTERICKKLDDNIPTLSAAFGQLLSFQSSPYTQYRGWPTSGVHGAEIVRFAMIDSRAQEGASLGRFTEQMNKAAASIAKK